MDDVGEVEVNLFSAPCSSASVSAIHKQTHTDSRLKLRDGQTRILLALGLGFGWLAVLVHALHATRIALGVGLCARKEAE